LSGLGGWKRAGERGCGVQGGESWPGVTGRGGELPRKTPKGTMSKDGGTINAFKGGSGDAFKKSEKSGAGRIGKLAYKKWTPSGINKPGV